MDVASLCPLPVGVLAWNAPQPLTTVIVKGTFSMARDGQAVLADQQEPLSLDRTLAGAKGELYYASDFVPLKQAVDVLMVGHARASAPTTLIPFALSIAHRRVSWVAVSDKPALAIPLLQRHVREQAQDPASARRLAPAPHRVRGWLSRTIPGQFDFSAFNAAIPEHRVSDLGPGTTLVLEGLLPGAPLRAIELTSLAPYLFHVPSRDPASLCLGQRVALVCDTLWIDVDRALFTLTWRGTVQRTAVGTARPLLAAVLRPADQAPSWTEVAPQLDGATWYEAVSETKLAPGPPLDLEGETVALDGGDGSIPPLPPGPTPSTHGEPLTSPLPLRRDASHTMVLDEMLPVHARADDSYTQVLESPLDGQAARAAAPPSPPSPAPAEPGPPQRALPPEDFGNITSTSWPRNPVLDAARARGDQLRRGVVLPAAPPPPRPQYPTAALDDDEATGVMGVNAVREAAEDPSDDEKTDERIERKLSAAELASDEIPESSSDLRTAAMAELPPDSLLELDRHSTARKWPVLRHPGPPPEMPDRPKSPVRHDAEERTGDLPVLPEPSRPALESTTGELPLPAERPRPRLDSSTGELPVLDDDESEPSITTGVTDVLQVPHAGGAARAPQGRQQPAAEQVPHRPLDDDEDTNDRNEPGAGEDDDIEPAPITPRAGLRLGAMGGFALGGSTLTKGSAGDGLPFDPSKSASAPPPALAATEDEEDGLSDEQTAAGVELRPPSAPPLPFVGAGGPGQTPSPPPAPSAPPPRKPAPTLMFDETPAAGPALPFRPGAAIPPPLTAADLPGTARRFGEDTRTDAFTPGMPALPFAQMPPGTPEPSPAPPQTSSSPPPAGVPPPHPQPRPPQPKLTAEPPKPAADQAAAKPERTEAPTLPLETYAAIKAQLWDRPAEMEAILSEQAIDESTWRAIERRQALAIARDASSGSGKLAVTIRQAISAARRKFAGAAKEADTELDIDEYAALRVAVDDADDPAAVLEKRGLSQASWDRLQRTWSHRAKADGRIAAELRRKMAAARLEAASGDGG